MGWATTTLLAAQTDALTIIRHAVAADARNWIAARDYAFLQREELKHFDAEGKVKRLEVLTYDVTLQDGTPYQRLVQRDDRALSSAETNKELANLARSLARRRQESGAERSTRRFAYEGRPQWQHDAWRELPDAFEFRLVGEERVEGRDVFVVEATPRIGYQPQSHWTQAFRSIRGKLWIDQLDYQLVKAEAEATDTISFGLFLVRIARGSRATVELTRIAEATWLPSRVQVSVGARFGLLPSVRLEQLIRYSQYIIVPSTALAARPPAERDLSEVWLNRPHQAAGR
jgi:hypothetical protein